MSFRAYYNEFDPKAAQWLRNLIAAGHLPAGDVDERSIEDVTPNDLRGYVQCHFFAGIGGWPLALTAAGWPLDQLVWTGSCPCQPFSAAGKGAGFADERHLWPAWQHLIAQCRPPVVFGEQVASAAAGSWIDLVHADVEGMGYAFGCVPFPAASVEVPGIRDRTYWVADTLQSGRSEGWAGPGRGQAAGRNSADWVADADCDRLAQGRQAAKAARHGHPLVTDGRNDRLADACCQGLAQRQRITGVPEGEGRANAREATERGGLRAVDSEPAARAIHGGWADADWLLCTDGRWRPVEPGTFPLAHGVPGRVVRLRAYGNAIVPAQAVEFILAWAEARGLTLATAAQQVAA
jgi:DNA (cytosine-5)-methyltransferase 1